MDRVIYVKLRGFLATLIMAFIARLLRVLWDLDQGRYGKRNWRTSSSENARIKPRTTKESYRPLPGYFSLDFHPGNNRELLFLAHAGALG